MDRAIKLLQELSNARGASGFEDEVVAVARRFAQGLGRIEEDCLRNLYVYRKENTGNRPVIMVDAHSDEVGLMVHSIKPNGTLRFVSLGSWNKSALPAARMLIRNALGEYIPGIVAAKPVHFMSAAERANPTMELRDMVIDIGASSQQEAQELYHIRIGEPVVPATEFYRDGEHDLLMGKGFDCRIGCAALLEALRRLEGKELPCDVVGVLSAQEEVGERGCKVAVNRVRPNAAIVLEGCPADDTFTEPYAIQTALGKGPMLRFMDVSAICNPRFQRYALDLAKEKNIPVQASVREGGGNNAAVINTALLGAPAIVAGVPVRYIHTTNCISRGCDLESAVRLVMALLENMTPETLGGF